MSTDQLSQAKAFLFDLLCFLTFLLLFLKFLAHELVTFWDEIARLWLKLRKPHRSPGRFRGS